MHRNIAFVFPGQGSQMLGMGFDFYNEFSSTKALFDKADALLGFPLTKIMFDGPREELQKTENTQPALLVTSIAILRLVEEAGISAGLCAGHSLGEFSAYVCAGSLGLEDAIRVVRKRGELMALAGSSTDGAMAAIIGLSDDVVINICKQASEGQDTLVVPANFNCPGQVVISGYRPFVERAIAIAKESKARMAVELKVSGAFHSPLIQDVEPEFERFLSGINIKEPVIPVISNVSADTVDTSSIRHSWVRQLTSPVLWTKSILALIDRGVDTFVEIGSGKVLQGLIKKTNRDVKVFGVSSIDTLHETLSSLA